MAILLLTAATAGGRQGHDAGRSLAMLSPRAWARGLGAWVARFVRHPPTQAPRSRSGWHGAMATSSTSRSSGL